MRHESKSIPSSNADSGQLQILTIHITQLNRENRVIISEERYKPPLMMDN